MTATKVFVIAATLVTVISLTVAATVLLTRSHGSTCYSQPDSGIGLSGGSSNSVGFQPPTQTTVCSPR